MWACQWKYFLQTLYQESIFDHLTTFSDWYLQTWDKFVFYCDQKVWKVVDYLQHYRWKCQYIANILIFIALHLKITTIHSILIFIEFMQTISPTFNINLDFILLQSKIISVTNGCVVATFLLSANIKTLIFTWNIIMLSQNIEQMNIIERGK